MGIISAHWNGFVDAESSVERFEWCVGTSPGLDDVVACRDVGAATTATVRASDGDVAVQALLTPAFGAVVAAAAAAPSGLQPDGSLAPAVLAMLSEKNTRLPVYYSTVTAVNELGMTATGYSDGVSIDMQPPTVGWVIDSPDPDTADVSVQTSQATLWVSWFGFGEFQTSLDHYEVTVSSSLPGDSAVATLEPWLLEPTETSAALNDLALTNGATYFVTVTAVDKAGLRSSNTTNGVQVDATGPVAQYVRDAATAAEAQAMEFRAAASNSTVTLMWAFVDAESGVASYRVRLCPALPAQAAKNRHPCVLEWSEVQLRTSVTLYAPALSPGIRYVADVEATSVSGVTTLASSNGFIVDGTDPVEGSVTVVDAAAAARAVAAASTSSDDAVAQLPGITLQGSWDMIAAQWTGFSDAESGLLGYSVCVGTSPLAADLVPCHDVGMVNVAVVHASAASAYAPLNGAMLTDPLTANTTTLYVTVIARNRVGGSVSVVSPAVEVDATAPVTGLVLDGRSGQDAIYASHPSELCVAADGFYDLETGVQRYDVCVGTTPGQCSVSPFRLAAPEPVASASFGTAESSAVRPASDMVSPFDVLCARDVPLQHDQYVYVTVRAVNGAGVTAQASSNGVRVVLQPPALGSVVDAAVTEEGTIDSSGGVTDVAYYGQRITVAAAWWGFGSSGAGTPPITGYEVALCGAVSGCQNVDNQLSFFADVGLSTNITAGGMGLVQGEVHHWHVRATDASGQQATAISNGFMVDSSPPEGGSVAVLSYGIVDSSLNPAGIDITPSPLSDNEVAVARALVAEDGAPLWHGGFAPLHVSWLGFGDAQSGVAEFQVCVGLGPDLPPAEGRPSTFQRAGLVPCRVLPSSARSTVFVAADMNATAVALAQAQGDAAAEVVEASTEQTGTVDPETGLLVEAEDAVEEDADEVSGTAVFTAIVEVAACNRVGLCTRVRASEVAVDLSPPSAGGVSGAVLGGLGAVQRLRTTVSSALQAGAASCTAATHEWAAVWDAFTDPESDVAMYTAAVVDAQTGQYAMAPTVIDSGSVLTRAIGGAFASDTLALQHGHSYQTEVTATNFAGLPATARSLPTLVDTTPPSGGFLFDVRDGQDAAELLEVDYGDSSEGAIEAAWGGWEDAESGVAAYEWAVLALDPRERNPISASQPGALLRAAVLQYLEESGAATSLAPRAYGTGHATELYQVDAGVQLTAWVPVFGDLDETVVADDGSYRVFRDDLDIVPGVTYVVLLRVTNECGLATLAASDGVVMDDADPCIGQPHAGLDPGHIPQYLTTEGQATAVWGANIDPLRGPSVPFECATDSTINDTVTAIPDYDDVNSTAEAPLVAVQVVPLSHMEWQLRKLVPPLENRTAEAAGSIYARAVAGGNDTAALQDIDGTDVVPEVADENTTSLFSLDASNITSEDAPVDIFANQTTSQVVMGPVQAGPLYASPWSGCCSSYAALNPELLQPEWTWRPVSPLQRFASGLSVMRGRFIVAAGAGSMTVFDTLHPDAAQHMVSVASLDTAANASHLYAAVAGGSNITVSGAGDAVLVAATAASLTVLAPPPLRAHAWAPTVPSSEGVLGSGTAALTALHSLRADDSRFTQFVSNLGATFGGTSLTGAVATRGSTMAATLQGVVGVDAARAVAVLRLGSDGAVLSAIGVEVDMTESFGTSLAFAAAANGLLALAVGVPGECAPPAGFAATSYTEFCAGPPTGAYVQLYGVPATIPTVSLGPVLLPPGAGVDVPTATPGEEALDPSPSFGIAVAGAAGIIVVGDPKAGNDDTPPGQVTVFAVSHDDAGSIADVAADPMCAVLGVVPDGGFGYSVAAVGAADEGVGVNVNAGTTLVAVGAPGANLVTLVRINATAFAAGSTGDLVCQVIAQLRASGGVLSGRGAGTVPAMYGAGTAVAIGGGMVLVGSPFARTWPLRANASAAVAAGSGTGRLLATSFCWAGQARRAAVAVQANVPAVCVACDAAAGEWSAGGVSGVCESCGDRVCRSVDDGSYFTAVNNSAPLELGASYELDITGVSRSGRTTTATSPQFTVDWTPPATGEVRDAYVGNATDGCTYCEEDIDYNTNATYLSATWCWYACTHTHTHIPLPSHS